METIVSASVLPWERVAPGRHLVEDHAEREDVGAVVDRLPLRLLRRHVGDGAEKLALPRQCVFTAAILLCSISGCLAGRLREAEVEDLDLLLAAHQDVGWLEVAVHDATLVRDSEGIGQGDRHLHEAGKRQSGGRDVFRQGASLDQFHGEEGGRSRLLHRIDSDDVRMIDGGERQGFLLEPGESLRVFRERLGQDFDRHLAL
jgi:hypothetical protein